jgi:hypothetical protein
MYGRQSGRPLCPVGTTFAFLPVHYEIQKAKTAGLYRLIQHQDMNHILK